MPEVALLLIRKPSVSETQEVQHIALCKRRPLDNLLGYLCTDESSRGRENGSDGKGLHVDVDVDVDVLVGRYED